MIVTGKPPPAPIYLPEHVRILMPDGKYTTFFQTALVKDAIVKAGYSYTYAGDLHAPAQPEEGK